MASMNWSRVKLYEAKLLCWVALKRASSRLPCGNKKEKIEWRNGDKSEGEWRFWQKLHVYRPVRCPAEEITCRGKRSSRQNIAALFSVLAPSLTAGSDIHPDPSTMGHGSSGWNLQAPEASSHLEETGAEWAEWCNQDKPTSASLGAGGRRKGQGP